jgi:hypothetical protein
VIGTTPSLRFEQDARADKPPERIFMRENVTVLIFCSKVGISCLLPCGIPVYIGWARLTHI